MSSFSNDTNKINIGEYRSRWIFLTNSFFRQIASLYSECITMILSNVTLDTNTFPCDGPPGYTLIRTAGVELIIFISDTYTFFTSSIFPAFNPRLPTDRPCDPIHVTFLTKT